MAYGIESARTNLAMLEKEVAGIEVKFIAPIDMHNIKIAKKIKRIGVKIRNYPVKGLRMHIVDNEYAMITIVDKKNPKDRNIIKINQKESVQTLRDMFLLLWEKSKEIK